VLSLPPGQARRFDVMPKSTLIAMGLSVAIHLVLFTIADWMLGDAAFPSVSNSVLRVSIDPLQSAGDVADNEPIIPAEDNVAANTMENRQAAPPAARPPENQVVATRDDAFAETSAASLLEATEVTEVTGITESAPVAIVTTTKAAEPVVVVAAATAKRPVVVQAALSPKQQKMLNRKVTEWTETLYKMPDATAELTWTYDGQQYQATFTELPAADDMEIRHVIAEISTEEGGKRMSSEVHMKQLAFSNYAQFVNRWDPRVQIHNDELDGRFHSNSEISLNYDRKIQPTFHGKVTTASRSINFTDSRGITKRDQMFLGGLQTGVSMIRLRKHVLPFPGEAAVADDQVQRFSEDTRVTFYADGSYAWQPVDAATPQQAQVVNISENTMYLVADKNVAMYVKGIVNGKVLVYSPERIVIEDDLVYAQNPEEVAGADDYLGLVSDKYVDVAAADITGPGDLLINAAIYAKRRFAVRGYRTGESALLYLYGSLSVGTLSATEPRYYTRIQFDQRLEEMRPPGFPMTDRYEVESWDAAWSVESTD